MSFLFGKECINYGKNFEFCLTNMYHPSVIKKDKKFFFVRIKFKFKPKTFITIKKPSDKKKILCIRDTKEFDKFTKKFGKLREKKFLQIDWNKVKIQYGGIDLFSFSKPKLVKERWDKCIYKKNIYESWLPEYFPKKEGGFIWNYEMIRDLGLINIGKKKL